MSWVRMFRNAAVARYVNATVIISHALTIFPPGACAESGLFGVQGGTVDELETWGAGDG